MNDLGFGITLALRDAFSKNANRIEGSYRSLDSTIAASSEKINQNLERVQKGAMLMGAGIATLAIPAALAKSTFETQKVLGEMRSLGIKDLNALAIRFEGLIKRGEVQDYADIARLGMVSRARISQLMNFLLLAPDIQEDILFLLRILKGREPITERDVRPIVAVTNWSFQRKMWAMLKKRQPSQIT